MQQQVDALDEPVAERPMLPEPDISRIPFRPATPMEQKASRGDLSWDEQMRLFKENERWLSMRRAIEDEHVFRFNPENWEKYLKAQPPSRHIEDSRKFDPTKVLMDTSLQ